MSAVSGTGNSLDVRSVRVGHVELKAQIEG